MHLIGERYFSYRGLKREYNMDKERVMEIHSNHNVFSSQQILTNVRLPMVVVVTNVEILGVRSPVRVRLDIS